MKKISILIVAVAIAAGCSSFSNKYVAMRHVSGDIWIRSIASDNQEPAGEGTNINAESTSLPVDGIPAISAALAGKGMFAGYSVIIEEVSGSIFIEEAGNRNQGVIIKDTLEKLFVPGDPFAVTGK